VSDDPVGDALHAEAEAARAQIRAAGIACPSCGVNMADLPDGHELVIYADEDAGWNAECRDGAPAPLSMATDDDVALGKWRDATSVAVRDAFKRREGEMSQALIGRGTADFTGLLNVLGGDA